MLLQNTRLEGPALKSPGIVCHVSEARGKVAILELPPENSTGRILKKPFAYELSWIIKQIDRDRLKTSLMQFHLAFSNPKLAISDDVRREKAIQVRDQNYQIIEPIVTNSYYVEKYLYTREIRPTILEIARANNCTEQHIYRLINRYFLNGCSPDALIPLDFNKGNNYTTPEKSSEPGKRRGRRPRFGLEFRNCTLEDVENIKHHIKKCGVKTLKNKTKNELFEEFDATYQVVEFQSDPESHIQRIGLPPKLRISPNSYFRVLEQQYDERFWIKKKVGSTAYRNDHESTLCKENKGLIGPAQRYAIDATPMNIYIRYPFEREKLLSSGRPWLYLVKDVYSNLTTGFFISHSPPSWFGVGQALLNAFSDKVDFCKRYGIDIKHEEWPCMHVCSELLVDNGPSEYALKRTEQPNFKHIGLEKTMYTPVYMGRAKGGVESENSIQSGKSVNFIPGALDEITERDGRHSSNFAVLHYNDLVRVMIYSILKHNRKARTANVLDRNMAMDKIDTSPLASWIYGMKHYMGGGMTRVHSPEDLLMSLLPYEEASTTEKGILLKGIYYNSEYAHRMGWLTSRKGRTVKKLQVCHSYESTNHIWFRSDDGVIHTGTISDHSKRIADINHFDAMHLLEIEKHALVSENEGNRQADIDTFHKTREIVAYAEDLAKEQERSEGKSIQSGIKDRQKQEAMYQKYATDANVAKLLNRSFSKHASKTAGSTLDSMIEE